MSLQKNREHLLKAANLFARVTGAVNGAKPTLLNGGYSKEDAKAVVEALQESLDDDEDLLRQVVLLRQAWDEYLDVATCSLSDIVRHMQRGDIVMQFSQHTILNRMITEGTLNRLYKHAIRKSEE
jgi:hypothetical protein